MATKEDLAPEHRGLAGRMKHLERMPAEEARHRAAHVHKLEAGAPMSGEGRTLMLAHASRILGSLPVGEYLDQIKHYNDTANAMPGGGVDSPAHDLRQAAVNLKASNAFPPGLLRECEKRQLGQEAFYPDCDIDAVLGLDVQKSKPETARRKAKPGEGYCVFCGDAVKGTDYVKGSPHWGGKCQRGSKTEVEKSVKAAMAAYDSRVADLRKQIDDYKAKIAADHAKANRPIPVGLNIRPDQHPNAKRIRELESEANRLRNQAGNIGEVDLAESYLTKARAAEGKAAELRRAIGA